MARANFSKIEEDIRTIRSQVTKDQDNAKRIDRLARVLDGGNLAEMKLDMDDQGFDAVRENNVALTENIARLIQGLDTVTQSFSQDFKGMSEATYKEKIVGIFSAKTAAAWKADRVRSTSIDGSLTELIRKSDTIKAILAGTLETLQTQQVSVLDAQKNVNLQYERTAAERVELEARLEALAAEDAATRAKASEASGQELAGLESKISELANQLNETRETLQTNASNQQSLSLYRRQFDNYAESLAKQIAAQKTMIDKLTLDTQQRTVLYKTLTESIKATQQQELAHSIDSAGRQTDKMADMMMTQMGASSQNRIVKMMEDHKLDEQELIKRAGEREAANAKFAARFTAVLRDIENRYIEAQ